MTKKILFGLAFSVGAFLIAGQVLAVNSTEGNLSAGTVMTINATSSMESFQKMQGYMSQLQKGTLSSQDQKDMYLIMTQPPKMMGLNAGQGEFNVRTMPFGGGNMMYAKGVHHAPFALLFIITVALVWAALLLLIIFLFKQVKKHK